MPTFRHGRGTALLVDKSNVAQYFRDATLTHGVDLAETSTFGTFDKTYVVGMRDGGLSVSGLYDGTTAAIDEQLAALLGQATDVPVTYGPEGLVLARRTKLFNAQEVSYEVSSAFNDVVATSAEMKADGGVFHGVSLHDLTAESATTNGASVDNAASSAFGAVATMHATINSRNGTAIIKVQDSPDNAVWTDLITFATVSATTTASEILSVAGTVDRYLRATWTIAGSTGSITFHVSCARRID